jgi:hypothetical protein
MADPTPQPPDGAPPAPEPVYALDPDQQLVAIDPADAAVKSYSGYSLLSKEDAQQIQAQQQYGSLGQTVAAGAEGLASGATAGFSRNLEVAAGVPKEDIEGRAAANPIAHGAGELLGAGGALAVGTGELEGALGLGSLAVEAGGAGAEAAGGALATRMALGAATQGAYATGQEISEQDLDSIPFNAEAVLMAGGLGAAIGATGEGVFGLAGKALPAAARKLDGVLGKLGSKAADGFSSLSGMVTGQDPAVIRQMIADKAEAVANGGFAKLYRGIFDDTSDNAGRSFAKVIEHASDVHDAGRQTLIKDFDQSLMYQDPVPLMDSARAELADYQQRLAVAEANPNDFSRTPLVNKIKSRIGELTDTISSIKDRIKGKITDAAVDTPPQWGREASDIWHAMDKFRGDTQDVIPYQKISDQIIPEHVQTINWAKGLAHDAADFTKDADIWGDVGKRWQDWQARDARWIAAKRELLQTGQLGSKEFNERVIDPAKAQRMLKRIYANQDAYSGRLWDEVTDAAKGLNEGTKNVYAQVPSRSFDSGKMESMLNTLGDFKAKAMDAQGMMAATKELGGRGGLGIGRVGLVGYAAHALGMPTGLLAPVLGAYEAGRALSRPVKTIEAFARMAKAVKTLQDAIPKSAVDGVTGLLSGSRQVAKAGAYEYAKAHVLENQYTPDKTKDWHAATENTGNHFSQIVSNPQQLASDLGHGTAPLPPETRAATVAKAAQTAQYLAAKKPTMIPAPGILGGPPRMTNHDALDYARTLHVAHDPITALGQNLGARDLRASDIATAKVAAPVATSRWQSAVLDHVSKLLPEDVPLSAQNQLAIALERPGRPVGYASAMQASNTPPQPPPGAKTTPAKGNSTRKFKSEQANALRLPSEREVA